MAKKHRTSQVRKHFSIPILTALLFLAMVFFLYSVMYAQGIYQPAVRSIDTMKLSRDIAREKLNDANYDTAIDEQVKRIAALGATHVAIATPYDAEFLPYLRRWVAAARKYKLKVWFRGNFSGWEGWFEYPAISRKVHTQQIELFIMKNEALFEDGDIFTSCPECENGGPGDPRNGDLIGFRTFLIGEYAVTKKAFTKINKRVTANYYSMNGDVAKLVMDRPTTRALDGIVTIDHYVFSQDKLISDIAEIAEKSGGKIVLGEIGAPIPDIHGPMTEEQQAAWMAEAFAKLHNNPHVVGINYWTHIGGTTALWSGSGKRKLVADTLKYYYTDRIVSLNIADKNGKKLMDAKIQTLGTVLEPTADDVFAVPFYGINQEIRVQAEGFKTAKYVLKEENNTFTAILEGDGPPKKSWPEAIADWIRSLIARA